MDFPTYIDTIARSAPADWNVENGPLFFQPAPDPASAVLDASISTHAFVMAFRKNLSITMAYGMLCHTHVEADFVRFFPNPDSSLRYLDFFFNSALVFRETLISVDGGQGILPVPNPGPTQPWEVPRRKCAVARLVHQITNPMRDFDDYFAHGHLKAIDEYWPL
jgi:hypothetical protein